MPNNQLGELRRSSIISLFGPGAIVDFRADGAPVSAIIAGLEEWDRTAPPPGVRNRQSVHEPRLERRLGVKGFRLPPIQIDVPQERPNEGALAAFRFPDWLQCPKCGRIARSSQWTSDPGKAGRYCASCTQKAPGRRKVFAIPVRFVVACEKGHIDEFPWHLWVGHKEDCDNKNGALFLESTRPGLAGLYLTCKKCEARKSMDGIFSSSTWERFDFRCKGNKPWLQTKDGLCDQKPRVIQRGASNVYFPVVESALSIPPWSDRLQRALGVYWDPLINTEEQDRTGLIEAFARGPLKPVLEELQMTPETLAEEIQARIQSLFSTEISENSIRREEFLQLASGVNTQPDEADEFEIRNEKIPQSLRPFFSRIVRVVRLREVRVLKGFTRITPPEGMTPAVAPLAERKLEWLPAIEVRGEGIFIAFNNAQLAKWRQNRHVQQRIGKIQQLVDSALVNGEKKEPFSVTPEFILVHSFAHVLMRQLTLECGYSGASLRERLYVDDQGMTGLMIYTATPDTDGTLGGLQRQGETGRIEKAIKGSLESVEWCSSDPLCVQGLMAAPGAFSLAACHACMLVPETSCEHFNCYLDRALLVGLPEDPAAGFFSSLRNTGG